MGIENMTEQRGSIAIVGLGPGGFNQLTPEAKQALERATVVIGYKTYIDLIRPLIENKTVISTGMMKEIDRCKNAIELAHEGKQVAIVSSGDPGIYGMAGPIFELLSARYGAHEAPAIDVAVIAGISALNASAALLGCPLMHDFASISLSDLLTPWETIEKRIRSAAEADFVIVFYNPKSKGRTEQIEKAIDIIACYRSKQTPAGIVRNASREEQSVIVTTLDALLQHPIDMLSSVIIGNSNTFQWNNLMITPRGYDNKYAL
jgi:precorrin-3B C17-methyltransferase